MSKIFPTNDMAITHILTVSNLEKAKHFYSDILGARLDGEYGGTSLIYNFCGGWLLVVTGGGETDDKPGTRFVPPQEPNDLSHAMTIRVKNCQESYEILKERGADFITPPYDWGYEIRCFFRDPDGHLFEISEITRK